jgi:hypothetical protein
MALEDYVPNIFGGTPTVYQGLLSPQEQASLEKRSNLAGLLGFGAALAQGMGGGGYRRSALQNILSAAAQGFSGAGQTYQAGIGQIADVQKLQQARRDMERQQQARQAMQELMNTPEVANNPTLKAYFLANPEKALERYMNIQETKIARGVQEPMVGVQPTPTIPPVEPMIEGMRPTSLPAFSGQPETFAVPMETAPVEPAATRLPPVEVVKPQSRYARQLREAEAAQKYFSNVGNTDRAKAAREEADNLRGLIRQEELAESVGTSLEGVHPMLKGMVESLNLNAPSMTASEIQSAITDIRKKDSEFRLNSETDLRKEYSGLPAIKEFSTVQTAHKQVINALNNPSAANDLAAATKFMKLLDPGSVVRESELGMAMAATGAIDLMGNYLQRLQNGERLNPAQRADFKKAAELAYRAAEDTYNQISNQYVDLAKSYNLNPNNIVLKQKKSTESPMTPAGNRPEGVGKDWTLNTDAQGNKAWVSPDRTQFKEVK